MKAIIIGMGVQGSKRKKFLGKHFKFSVDIEKKSNYKKIEDVPVNLYDSVYACIPDDKKLKIIKYALQRKKNVLVEKPLIGKNSQIRELEKLARKNKVFTYTAYNHRFEPSLIKAKEIISKKVIGKIYSARLFYGNGTSMLVKKSKWRDKKKGIVTDLGSHLLDICLFLFNSPIKNLKLIQSNRFENKTPDHALLNLKIKNIIVNMEMSYTMWKNSFHLDLIGSKGSLHVDSLCKWSNSKLSIRKRKFPSGIPKEKIIIYKKGDPTWKIENKFFINKVKLKSKTSLKKDILINTNLNKLI
jgi:scyllo-inositol 2-dehydrogenase (NADP+)|tara:strand:- start:1186 stop:2085 length:900 start_codon:yes stop_codon:yes gene_type:complete